MAKGKVFSERKGRIESWGEEDRVKRGRRRKGGGLTVCDLE